MYNTTQLTSLKGDIMIYWLCTMTECSKTGKTVQTVRNEFYSEAKKNGVIDSVSSFQSSPIYTEMGKQFLKDNKIPFIKSSINGCIRLLFSPGTYFFIDHFQLKIEKTKFNTMASSNLLQSIKYYLTDKSAIEILFITLYTIFLVICYISAIKGIYVLYIQREFKVLLPIIAVIVFFIVITGIIGSARYRIPFIAFVFILSSIGISSFVQIKK